MGRKNLIYNFKPLIAGDMTQAILTGAVTDISQFDIVTYDFSWSGGQVTNGNISIQYSRDGVTWTTLDFGSLIGLNSSSGNHTLIIDEVGFQFVRPVFTRTNVASSGLLDIAVFCTTRGA